MKKVQENNSAAGKRHNKLVAKADGTATAGEPRILGAHDGWFEVPDEAFAPLTDEELKDWFGD